MIEVRSFLREQTSALHRELDAIVGAFSNRAEYAHFLQGTFRHRAPVESALLESAAARSSSWLPSKLVPALKADLADLGVPLPTAEPLYLSNDMAAFLGAAYVLEGSALGGRVLVKGVDAAFGPEFGARYLSAQAGSLDSWRSFLATLEGLERSEWAAAAHSAKAVFSHAIRAFTSEELSPA